MTVFQKWIVGCIVFTLLLVFCFAVQELQHRAEAWRYRGRMHMQMQQAEKEMEQVRQKALERRSGGQR